MYKSKNFLKNIFKYLIFILIFFIPLLSRMRIEYSGGLIIGFSLIIYLLCFFKLIKINTDEIFLISFVIFYFISAFLSKEREISFVWSGYILSWAAFYYFGKKIKDDRKIVSNILILSLIFVLSYCFWQFFIIFPATREYFAKHTEIAGNFSSNVYSSIRLYGTFLYPNSLAAYFILISGVMWSSIFNKNKIYKVRIVILTIIWLIISFFIWQTGSRVGIIIWLVEVLFIIIILFKSSKKISLIIFTTTFIGILISTVYLKLNQNENIETILERKISTNTTISAKLLTYLGSLKIIKNHPIVGCGPGNFSHYYAQYRPEKQRDLPHSAHNIFLDIAANAGIISLIFFLLFIIFSLKNTIKNPLIFVSLFMLLLHSCADWNFKNIGIALLFFFLLGLYRDEETKHIIKVRFSKILSIVLIILVIISIYFQVRSGIAGMYFQKAEEEFYFNNRQKAVVYFETAINFNPYRAEYYIKAAFAQSTLRNTKDYFKKALEYAPDWNEPYYHLARISLLENNIEEAKYYIKEALQLFPSSEKIILLNDSLSNLQ